MCVRVTHGPPLTLIISRASVRLLLHRSLSIFEHVLGMTLNYLTPSYSGTCTQLGVPVQAAESEFSSVVPRMLLKGAEGS